MRKKLWLLSFILIAVGVIGLAFNKFDLSDNELVPVDKSWTIHSDELNELMVEGNSSDVRIEFIESDYETASITITGKLEPQVAERIQNIEVLDQILTLDLSENSRRLVQFNFTNPTTTIQVSMPKSDRLGKLIVSHSSGNTKVNGAKADHLILETGSGNISLVDVQANEAVIISQSGNVKAENITSKLMTTSSSGSIKVMNFSGELTAETKSGNVTAVQTEAGNADVTTSSGDVKFTAASNFDGFYDVRSSSGDIKVPDNNGTLDKRITINTGSGNITVKK